MQYLSSPEGLKTLIASTPLRRNLAEIAITLIAAIAGAIIADKVSRSDTVEIIDAEVKEVIQC